MRRELMCALMLILAALMAPGVASAEPTVKIEAEAVPIPGFPHTGDILGADTAARGEIAIEGNEYFGSPPPIIGVNVHLPLGVQLHPNGFPTCEASAIENVGPSACPRGSAAGPVGKAIGFVTFGGERVEETAELFTFYGPGGGGIVFADGHTPVSLEILSTERLVKAGDRRGSGPGDELQRAAPRRERARRAVCVGPLDRSRSRLRLSLPRSHHLLRSASPHVPTRRLASAGGSHLRRRRRIIAAGDGRCEREAALPERRGGGSPLAGTPPMKTRGRR